MSAEENKCFVLRLMEEIDKGNLDGLDQFFSTAFVDHNPLAGGRAGFESLKQSAQKFHAAFPDTRHVIEHIIAEDDKVVVSVLGRGTFSSEFMGMQPTGKQIEMRGIAIYRIAHGWIVEKWAMQDRLSLMLQLGATWPDSVSRLPNTR